jgi:hypothetical protein
MNQANTVININCAPSIDDQPSKLLSYMNFIKSIEALLVEVAKLHLAFGLLFTWPSFATKLMPDGSTPGVFFGNYEDLPHKYTTFENAMQRERCRDADGMIFYFIFCD